MVAPTSLFVTVDDTEYSRFEADRSVVSVIVTAAGANMLDEEVEVRLVKSRRNKDISVALKTLTLTSEDTADYDLQFDLSEITDSEGVPKVRRGDYLMRATSVTDPNIEYDSEDFIVSLITVGRLKSDYLHGTDQKASELLTVVEQPILITGVEVTEVSKGTPSTWIPLIYKYFDNGTDITRTLSWCNGPPVTIVSTRKSYLLRRGSSSDYIRVKVANVNNLPVVDVTEELLVDRKPFDDARMRQMIDQAISWVEDVALSVYIEPTNVVTEPDSGSITYPEGTDIPVLVNADWDCVVDAVTFRRAAAGRWINFKLPYYPLIRFNDLYGQIANTRIVDIALEWVEAHEKGGFVELVPFNQEVAFNFIGLIWVEALRGPVPLPNFWNFDAIVGYRKTPPILLELVAKKVSIDILTIAGQAFRGGYSSQSVSRDGISESVSYTASATYGIYSATIEDYRKWIDENLVKLKGAFSGARMVVL
jgi:hypothetical protein